MASFTITQIPHIWEHVLFLSIIPENIADEMDQNYHCCIRDIENSLHRLAIVDNATSKIVKSERFLRCLLEFIFPTLDHYCRKAYDFQQNFDVTAPRQQSLKSRQKWSRDLRHKFLERTTNSYSFIWNAIFTISKSHIDERNKAQSRKSSGFDEFYYTSDPIVCWPLSTSEICYRESAMSPISELRPHKNSRLLRSVSDSSSRINNLNLDDSVRSDEGYFTDSMILTTTSPLDDYVVRDACCLRVVWKQPTLITSDTMTVFILHPLENKGKNGGCDIEGDEEPLSAKKIWYPPLKEFLFEDLLTTAYNCDRLEFIGQTPQQTFGYRKCQICHNHYPLCGKYNHEPVCGTCLHVYQHFYNR